MEALEIKIPETVVRPEFVVPVEQLLKDLDHINILIEQRVDHSNMELLGEMIEELSSWLAKATDLESSALFYLKLANKLAYENVAEAIKKKDIPSEFRGMTSPSVLKEYIQGRCATYHAIYSKAERTHRSLTHRFEALRTLLSKEKEVYKMTYRPQNQM